MKILLLGIGVSTLGAKRLLEKHKIDFDMLKTTDLKNYDYDLVVKSPGISDSNKTIKAFLKNNTPIITDIELVKILECPFIIGVTGSNGKTSTASAINSILGKYYKASLCGNIGYSVCDAIVDNPKKDFFIVELSSFQLSGVKNFYPNIAIITNIEPCHLDYHETFENYIMAKANITLNQTENEYLIYNYDNYNVRRIANMSKALKLSFSASNPLADCYILNNFIYYKKSKLIEIPKSYKNKKYMIENYMAVIITLKILNKYKKRYVKRLFKLKPIMYRAEAITKSIINDAKSTNPYSTIETLKRFTNISLICGGYYRCEDLSCLKPYLNKINKVYAYGETKDLVFTFMKENNVNVNVFTDLKEAIKVALSEMNKKSLILYSPMFASFDQYKSYLDRGYEFKEIIKSYQKKTT